MSKDIRFFLIIIRSSLRSCFRSRTNVAQFDDGHRYYLSEKFCLHHQGRSCYWIASYPGSDEQRSCCFLVALKHLIPLQHNESLHLVILFLALVPLFTDQCFFRVRSVLLATKEGGTQKWRWWRWLHIVAKEKSNERKRIFRHKKSESNKTCAVIFCSVFYYLRSSLQFTEENDGSTMARSVIGCSAVQWSSLLRFQLNYLVVSMISQPC